MAVPALFRLTHEERKTSIDKLIDGASPNAEFYLLLVLAAIITSLGVLLDSVAIVIGGMLVAPIISPILSFAMSIVMADFKLLVQSGKVLIVSVLLVMAVSLIVGLFYVNVEVTTEISSRTVTSIGYLVVAIAAGIAAAFAFARPSLSEAIPGIAVTVALLPPLVVSALSLTLKDSAIFFSSFGLFLLNLIGIIFAAIIIFSLMGFYAHRHEAVEKLEEEIENKGNSK